MEGKMEGKKVVMNIQSTGEKDDVITSDAMLLIGANNNEDGTLIDIYRRGMFSLNTIASMAKACVDALDDLVDFTLEFGGSEAQEVVSLEILEYLGKTMGRCE